MRDPSKTRWKATSQGMVQRFAQTLNRDKTRDRIMKIAAVYHDSENFRSFREGDTVRYHDDDDNCMAFGATGFGSILSTIATLPRSRASPATTISLLGRSRKALGAGYSRRPAWRRRGRARRFRHRLDRASQHDPPGHRPEPLRLVWQVRDAGRDPTADRRRRPPCMAAPGLLGAMARGPAQGRHRDAGWYGRSALSWRGQSDSSPSFSS